jgi:hypothetical protein
VGSTKGVAVGAIDDVLMMRVLQQIAKRIQDEGSTSISHSRAMEIVDALANSSPILQSAHKVLRILIERSGILVEVEGEGIRFSHRSFFEYFTGQL